MSDNKKFVDLLLSDRYYLPGETSWDHICKRVCSSISGSDSDKYSRFYHLMSLKAFCPASPVLMSAGTEKQMMSSCFILDIEDSMKSILDTVRDAGIITCAGGGIGFDFSKIRPENSYIESLGKKAALGPVGVLKMINALVGELKQSGRRKGACMGSISVHHPDILKFIKCKAEDGKLSNFNLSVLVDNKFIEKAQKKDTEESKILDEISTHACNTGDPGMLFYDRMNEHNGFTDLGIDIHGANTCVTGDTLVAVADGRNYVSIKDLAEAGSDVLVHCIDTKTGESHARLGRKPRLTRKNQDVYKITFDDGSTIKTTADHKFLLSNAQEIKAINLKQGDSLMSFVKYQEDNTTKGKKYWKVITRDLNKPGGKRCSPAFEHRLIAKTFHGDKSNTMIVHHIDDNPLNNYPENLEWIKLADHNRIENKLRGNMIGDNNPMFGKKHKNITKELISKLAVDRFKDPEYSNMMADSKKLKMTEDEAISIGCNFTDNHGQINSRKWDKFKISPSRKWLKRKFGSFEEFKNRVNEVYNHKVVSVEYFGREDVYNITVEEFSTVGYITNANGTTRKKKLPKLSGLYTRNCGEISGPPNTACLLGSVDLSRFVKDGKFLSKGFKGALDTAIEFLNAVLDNNKLPLDYLQEFQDKYRQIGLGITGFHDALIKMGYVYGSDESYSFAHDVGHIMKCCANSNKEKYKNTTSLTIAPTGSVSLMLDCCSFSIEPIYDLEMNRRFISCDGNAHNFKIVNNCWQEHLDSGKYDKSLFVTAKEISPSVHLKMASIFQDYLDNAISKTINLPAGSTPSDVRDIYINAWKLGLKGITVYVDQSKKDQVYSSIDKGEGAKVNAGPSTVKENISTHKKKRPHSLQGSTYKCRTADGSFYITINYHDGTAFEVFATSNTSDEKNPSRAQESNTNTEALTRIISLALRSGISPKDISEQLTRVKNRSMLSICTHLSNILDDAHNKWSNVNIDKEFKVSKVCPQCGNKTLVFTGSCWDCESCGWAKCT